MSEEGPLIPPHGGYAKLKTFQLAEVIFDVTEEPALERFRTRRCKSLPEFRERVAAERRLAKAGTEGLYRRRKDPRGGAGA